MTGLAELKTKIATMADRLKGGPMGQKAFVQSFETAVEANDSENTFFPEFFEDFRVETSGILTKVRATIEALGGGGEAIERQHLAESFRFCHMLKGSAATMGFNRLSYLAHGLERMFEEMKDSAQAPSPEMVSILREAFGLMEETIDGMRPSK